MKNLELLILFVFILFISACTNQNGKSNKKTKLKGDFVFKDKTIKNDSMTKKSFSETKVTSDELNYKKLTVKNKSLKPKDEKLKIKVNNKKLEVKKPILINDPVKVPEKWSNAYSNDPKWMELYEETSNAFLTGWSNEFQRNPTARISKDELLFAYRRRMEKIFYETPSFIEFSVNELGNSDRFKSFITDFQLNVQ